MAHLNCYKCQKKGHFARDCPSRKASSHHRGHGRRANYSKNLKIVTSSMWTILTTLSSALFQVTSDIFDTVWPYLSALLFSTETSPCASPSIKNLEGAYSRKFAIKHLLRPHEARKVRAQFFNREKNDKSLQENGKILTSILKPRIENYENLYNTKMSTDEITLILPQDEAAGNDFLPNIQSKDGITWTSVVKGDHQNGVAHDCILLKKRQSLFSGFQYEAYKIPQARLTLNSLDEDGPIVHLDKVETSSKEDTLVAITGTFDDGRQNIFSQLAGYVYSFFGTSSQKGDLN